MDFNMPGEDDPRRVEVRDWLEANPKPTYRELSRRGYTVPHWPKPYGLAADPEYQIIIEEELARAGIKPPRNVNAVAINNCAESLLSHGTDAQRARFLDPALACEEVWCMLFSEPSGGSDLASLRTTARREGDYYIINGQKTWNSLAHRAQIGVTVARTDSSVAKHAGLSQFLVDMNTPGVTVRPIIDMTGRANEYNEVFFDEVRVPVDRLLGKEGDGWKLCMLQLQTERVAMAKPGAVWGAGPSARELMAGLIETGRIKDPAFRDEAAKLYVEGEALRLLGYRSLSDRMNAKPAGPEAAARKMLASPHGQRLVDLAKRSQGPAGMIDGEEGLPLHRKRTVWDDWDYGYWFAPGISLGVGSQEMLKNVVAERVLGLPREADPTARVPWDALRGDGAAKASPIPHAA